MPLKSLENLLNPAENGGLSDLVRRAREMDQLLRQLQRSLGGEQGASIRAANVREDGTLVVLVSSPAWAARLRFEEEALLAAAREAGIDVSTCKVRVSQD